MIYDLLFFLKTPEFFCSLAEFYMEEEKLTPEELPTKYQFDSSKFELVAQGAEGVRSLDWL